MFLPPNSQRSFAISQLVLGTLFAVSLSSLAACSFFVEISDQQCERDEECLAIAADTECKDSICVTVQSVEDSRFGCRETPWKRLNNSAQTSFTIEVTSLSSTLPVEGMTIHRCNSLLDQACATPAATEITDVNGVVSFGVAEGFNGHFFAPATSDSSPMILHPFPPPDPDSELSQLNLLFPANASQIVATAALAGVAIVENTGFYLFTVQDCLGEALSGVQVTVSPRLQETEATYISTSGIPDTNLTQTGPAGTGALVNLPPGFVTIKAVHEEVGTIFEQTILIAPDTLTASRILPSER